MQRIGVFVVGLVVGGALLVGAVAIGLLQFAPAPKAHHTPQKHACTDPSGQCQVAVNVDCSTTPCTLWVDYDLLLVITQKKEIQITWQLQDSRYSFPDNGITFQDDAAQQFDNCHPIGNGKAFRCRDKSRSDVSSPDGYKYTITVTDTSGSQQITPLDPWVVND